MQRQQWNLCYVSIIHNTEKCPFIHFKNILLQGFATSWRISQKRNSILSEIIRIYLLFFALLQFRSFKKSQLRQQASFTQKDPTYSIAQIATTSNTILAAYASLQPHKSTHGTGRQQQHLTRLVMGEPNCCLHPSVLCSYSLQGKHLGLTSCISWPQTKTLRKPNHSNNSYRDRMTLFLILPYPLCWKVCQSAILFAIWS